MWRLRAPSAADEIRRTERWLASARVFLAVTVLVAIWMDPSELHYSPWATGLLAFYIAQSVLLVLLLRRRSKSTPAFRVLVHAADIVWPALISIFPTGQANPFFLFFVFVLAAAAYRWGLWETVGTAMAAVTLLWLESLALYAGWVSRLDQLLLHHHLRLLNLNINDFEPKRLFMLSVYLFVMGFLLGYLAEQQKQLRAEKAVIARVIGRARVEAGLTGTLQDIAGELMNMYGAAKTVIASQESGSRHIFVGEMSLRPGEPSTFTWLDNLQSDQETYLYHSAATASYARRQSDGKFTVLGLNATGLKVREVELDFLELLTKCHQFTTITTVSFLFGREWWGRIFLLDTILTGNTEDELRFLQELVRQLGPAVYNVYLLRRLRRRAGAVERARLARELHDGAVQSLIAVEMQVDVLRRQAGQNSIVVADELKRIQGLLREEVLKLRELMQQMKSLDVNSRKLLGFLNDTVDRFQRETGIAARFVSELDDLNIPQPVCRELACIVQEALVNVRKHSHASTVLVRMGLSEGKLSLLIEDDGSGFQFSGRLSQAELDTLGRGPVVIRERVRLIEGELTVESTPGRGSRIEISVPQQMEPVYG
ncbi:MAG: sensor histidine kinase [Terriglobales bacterium]